MRRRTDGTSHSLWKEAEHLGTDVDQNLLQRLRSQAATSSNATMSLFDSDLEITTVRVPQLNRTKLTVDSFHDEFTEPTYFLNFET